MNLLWLKSKLAIIGAALLTILAAVVRHKQVVRQRDNAKLEALRLRAIVLMEQNIREAENEIDQEFSHRAHEANREIEDGKVPRHLRNSNEY